MLRHSFILALLFHIVTESDSQIRTVLWIWKNFLAPGVQEIHGCGNTMRWSIVMQKNFIQEFWSRGLNSLLSLFRVSWEAATFTIGPGSVKSTRITPWTSKKTLAITFNGAFPEVSSALSGAWWSILKQNYCRRWNLNLPLHPREHGWISNLDASSLSSQKAVQDSALSKESDYCFLVMFMDCFSMKDLANWYIAIINV